MIQLKRKNRCAGFYSTVMYSVCSSSVQMFSKCSYVLYSNRNLYTVFNQMHGLVQGVPPHISYIYEVCTAPRVRYLSCCSLKQDHGFCLPVWSKMGEDMSNLKFFWIGVIYTYFFQCIAKSAACSATMFLQDSLYQLSQISLNKSTGVLGYLYKTQLKNFDKLNDVIC